MYTQDFKRKCIKLRANGMTRPQVYNHFFKKHYPEVTLNGFKTNMKRWEKKFREDEEYLENANLQFNYNPKRITVQLNENGEIKQSWIKGEEINTQFGDLLDLIKTLKPFPDVDIDKDIEEHKMLVIPFTDAHFGIATYEDYEQVIKDTLSIINRHNWEQINLLMGEDLLHTNDFKGHTSNLTYIGEVDIPKAYNDAIRLYSDLIKAALQKCLDVNVIYSQSNHSDSLSWTVIQVLKALYPKAKYDDEVKSRKTLTYHDVWIGFSHGDKVRGNLKDYKELFVEENLMDYANAKVKEILLGHLHHSKETGDINGCIVRRLPSAMPTDKWHYEKGYTMSVKRFQIFEYSRDRLLAIYYVGG